MEDQDKMRQHMKAAVELGMTHEVFVEYYAGLHDHGATPSEIEEARQKFRCVIGTPALDDEQHDIDEPTLALRGDVGIWVLGWLWLDRREQWG